MPTDYSIASQITVPKVDPLAMIGTLQNVQGGMLKNKLLGQNIQQTLAQRAAAQGAVDPDGQFNVDQYEGALAKGGASPEAIASAQQIRQQQIQNRISKMGLTKEQMAVSQQELGNGAMVGQGILANGTKDPSVLTKEEIATAISDNLIQPGLVKTPDGIAHAKQFIAQLTDDPQKNAQLVQQWVNQSTDITKAMGAIGNVDTGGHIVQQRINPATGAQDITGQIDKTRSPESKAGLVQTYNPETKQMEYQTSGSIVGDGPKMAPAAAGAPLGAPEAAAQNVHQAQALQQRASIVPQRKAALSNLSSTLNSFQPGPKADLTYQLGALATQFGLAPPQAAKGVAAQEEFNKLSAQIALDQWGSLGGTGTNDQLASTMKANPHQAMSQLGIKNVTALLQGNEDAIGAQYDAWQKYKKVHGDASYDTFQQGWNKYYDPRVFQAQHMAPADVKTMISKMSPSEKGTFQRDQSIAKQAGWLGQ